MRLCKMVAACLLCLSSATIYAEEKAVRCPVRAPFHRGVNLSMWFERPSARNVQFTYFSRETLADIKEMGADVIRLPIHFEHMSDGKPDYTIDPVIFEYLDQVVGWAEELGLYLIIDNHSFDSAHNTPANIEKRLTKIWSQIATRYKECSTLIMYEVLNEPHGITSKKWGKIQGKIIQLIRSIDPTHTIIAGGADWNSYTTLKELPVYDDSNIIYTYHFYDPFLFTHQGASWTDQSDIRHIPFPYRNDSMPPLPAKLKNTYVAVKMREYEHTGTEQALRNALQAAVDFSAARNVPVFCGEFGVLMTYADVAERASWYRIVRQILEEQNIAWTSWDYFGGFGLFNTPEGGIYPNDINRQITESLGFTPSTIMKEVKPPVLPYTIVRDGMIQRNIYANNTWGNGYIHVNAPSAPGGGLETVIEWGDCKRYGNLAFSFIQPHDLSLVYAQNATVELVLRNNNPQLFIELRFTNPDTAEQIPWRTVVQVTADMVPADGAFHTIRIPLAAFKETGAWRNSEERWYPTENKFNWHSVACIELVAEYGDMRKTEIQVKDIVITE